MRIKPSQLVAAGLVSGFLVLGGVSLASAQETPETTEPTTPSTVTPAAPSEDPAPTAPDATPEDPGCQDKAATSGDGTATATGGRTRGPRASATVPAVDASAV